MRRRTGWLVVAVVVLLASAGFVVVAGVAGSDTSVTVTQGNFTLTCPVGSVAEGRTLTCTLANTSDKAQAWPVVAILHLSSDDDRALVRGSLIDASFGARSPAADLDNGVEWIGETLVGYSRFDWSGEAGASPSTTTATGAHTRTVSIVANQDALNEGSERFYVALGPDSSRGVGLLYNNRQRVTVTDDDAESSNSALSSLKLTAAQQDHTLSTTGVSHSVTVEYEVTEATLTAEAAHSRAVLTMSASHGGNDIDLDGRGSTSAVVLSGQESLAVPLAVGTTAVTLTVTAENGTASSHRIDIVRQALGAATTVAVSSESFTLTCPATAEQGATLSCTLVNTSSSAAHWPVVAIIHSSADPDRALVAEDPIIPDTDPAYSKDVSLGPQQPQRKDFNYGYGELFSGGSHTVYRTYGFEKFDWSDDAFAGASRVVSVEVHEGDEMDAEVFYVAIAPSGYTGLSQLVDNKAPVIVLAAHEPDPSVTALDASGVTHTSATVTASVANPDPDGTRLYLRLRPAASQGPWITTAKTATTTSAEFTLNALTANTAYTVQVSFDSSFATDVSTGVVTETFTTDPPPPTVGFGAAAYRGIEGSSITIALRLSEAQSSPVRFRVRPKNGSTADYLSDYSLGECPPVDPNRDPPPTAEELAEAANCKFGVGMLEVEIPPGETGFSYIIRTEDDHREEGDEAFTLEISPLSSNLELGGNSEAVVTIVDNDTVGVEVGAEAVSVDEGASETYTVVLGSQPRDRVRVYAESPMACKVSVSPGFVEFESSNWSEPRTFRVRSRHDDDAADEEFVIAHRVEPTGSPGYAGVSADSVTVSVADKHPAAVMVSKGSLEPVVAATAVYRVYLNADPSPVYGENPANCNDYSTSHTVTITATSNKPKVATVSPASVTFQVGDNDPKTFTVTTLKPGTATIAHTISGTEPDYTDTITPVIVQSVTVNVTAPPAPQQAQGQGGQQGEGQAQGQAEEQAQGQGGQQAEEQAQGQAEDAGPVAAPVPGPVEAVALSTTAGSLTVGWSPPETGDPPTRYVLRLNEVGSSRGTVKTPKPKKTSVTFDNLEPGKTYKIWVRAKNQAGNGPRTFAVVTLPDASPTPDQPTNR